MTNLSSHEHFQHAVKSYSWLVSAPLEELLATAGAIRDAHYGRQITYSRKVFIPLTRLCRNICHYCTFAQSPRDISAIFLSKDEVIKICKKAMVTGCTEALITLGDKPEDRYDIANKFLKNIGHQSTISYLTDICETILRETTLLPHTNPGVLSREDFLALRSVTASQGMMLESSSIQLCKPGGVHYGSPDKDPARRFESLNTAGELKIPFTTGLLIGIGENRFDRIETLLRIKQLHLIHGHIQEVIIQGFRSKNNTKSAGLVEPSLSEIIWTIATARIILPPDIHLQTPPNLFPRSLETLISAGIDDLGGISPITDDHINPEAKWPNIDRLSRHLSSIGRFISPRLPVYPNWINDHWISRIPLSLIIKKSNTRLFSRESKWTPGSTVPPQISTEHATSKNSTLTRIMDKALSGRRSTVSEIGHMFSLSDGNIILPMNWANSLRKTLSGNIVRYVVNRNINYTNICYYHCTFCAFSKGQGSQSARGPGYMIDIDEIVGRVTQAWNRGGTEVCLQGGIHPDYDGKTYHEICQKIKRIIPKIHVHAFSPLEITQGAMTLDMDLGKYIDILNSYGLGTLPGTAAEILDDRIRIIICPDKISSSEWVDVMFSAHQAGIRSTSTIMFGHVDNIKNWAKHILIIRDIQMETGGFTEFVPLPFVHHEAPVYLRGQARQGPTLQESILMHSIPRLVLNQFLPNIQGSWVKLGLLGIGLCLTAGVNDLGGTLMDESISRAAGTTHGQELSPVKMEEVIVASYRKGRRRTTEYGVVLPERRDLRY